MRALIIDPGLQHKSKANSIPAKRIPVWAILLMLISTALFSSLGTWQLGRAEEKRAIFAAYAQGTAEAMREGLSGVDASEQRYQLLRLQGHYDTGHQLLLDNMSHAGQSGYHVLTPFITAGGSVLVNRGWVPADGDRRLLPNIDVSSQPRTLTGRIDRLGCKAQDRHPVVVYLPYLAGTADERQFRVMTDREQWFRVVMGQDEVAKLITPDADATIPLPASMVKGLSFDLGIGPTM